MIIGMAQILSSSAVHSNLHRNDNIILSQHRFQYHADQLAGLRAVSKFNGAGEMNRIQTFC